MVDKALLEWVEVHRKQGFDDDQLKISLFNAGYSPNVIAKALTVSNPVMPPLDHVETINPIPIEEKIEKTNLPIFIRTAYATELLMSRVKNWQRRTIFFFSALILSLCFTLGLFAEIKHAYGFIAPLSILAKVLAPVSPELAKVIARLYAAEILIFFGILGSFVVFQLFWMKCVGFFVSHITETITTDIPLESVKKMFRSSLYLALIISCFAVLLNKFFNASLLRIYLMPFANGASLVLFGFIVHQRSKAKHKYVNWIVIILLLTILIIFGVVFYYLVYFLPAQQLFNSGVIL